MKITATHNPPAHDDLRLQESEPYCDLVRMMIKRLYRDSLGKVGNEHKVTPNRAIAIEWAVRDGIEFMKGQGFRHYCELLGIDDPDHMLRMIEARESEN